MIRFVFGYLASLLLLVSSAVTIAEEKPSLGSQRVMRQFLKLQEKAFQIGEQWNHRTAEYAAVVHSGEKRRMTEDQANAYFHLLWQEEQDTEPLRRQMLLTLSSLDEPSNDVLQNLEETAEMCLNRKNDFMLKMKLAAQSENRKLELAGYHRAILEIMAHGTIDETEITRLRDEGDWEWAAELFLQYHLQQHLPEANRKAIGMALIRRHQQDIKVLKEPNPLLKAQ